MYTQCPDCSAVLEITAADLAVAGGFARCGQCGKSFDALRSISDSMPEPQAEPQPEAEISPADKTVAASAASDQPDAVQATDSSSPAGDESVGQRDPDVTVLAVDPDEDMPDEADGDDEASPDDDVSILVADDEDTPAADAIEDDDDVSVIVADDGDDETPDADAIEVDETPAAVAVGDDEDVSMIVADEAPAADVVEAEDDEILLDESYQPPEVGEEEPFLEDEWDDKDDAFTDTEAADNGEDDLFGGFDDAGDEIDADVVASLPDTGTGAAADDAADTGNAVDESALFALPLPELTALERDHEVVVPEKMEGGAAAQDPFAQTGAAPQQPEGPASDELLVQASTVTSDASDAYDAEDARDLRDYLRAPASRVATVGWSAGAAVMALLLIAQIVHRNRGELVIHPRFGPAVSSLYGITGSTPRPNWRIGEYKVVGQARLFEMPADDADDRAADSAALRFVAIISNGADRPQPPPLVRLTLRDRWGDPTGVRDFTPPEYLADRALVGELLEPGQRLRVVLNLHDPGADVVGFDFDMCLPDGAGTLRCAGEG